MGNEIMRHAMATADVIAGSLATPNARATWTVYRDGYRWTVGAKHLPDALRRACLQTDSMSGQQFVDAGARRELCEAPAPNGLPIALRCFTREIEAIYCDGLTAHVVDVSDTITHAQALDVLARAREDFVAVWAAALAAMVWVWDENGEPVTVRCYKTGAKGLSARSHFSRYQTTGKLERDGSIEWHNASLMPELLGILQRDDLIKWPRKTSAEEKARMLAGVVHNAALDEYVTAMQATLVFDTERACQRLVPPPKHVDEMTEVELRKRKAQHEAELAELPPNATARHEITTRDHDTRSRRSLPQCNDRWMCSTPSTSTASTLARWSTYCRLRGTTSRSPDALASWRSLSNTSPHISTESPRRSTAASLSSSTALTAPDPRRTACARRREAYGFSLHSLRGWCSLTP
jgi:hypothetical protein